MTREYDYTVNNAIPFTRAEVIELAKRMGMYRNSGIYDVSDAVNFINANGNGITVAKAEGQE